MKILMTSTMILGALCVLTLNQPVKAEQSVDPSFQLAKHGGGGGRHSGGHHHHHHGGGGSWGWGVGGLGLGLGLGVLGSMIYQDRYQSDMTCYLD